MLKIAAFDLSLTATGYAVPDAVCGTIQGVWKPSCRGMERLAWIRNRVLELAKGSELVVLEGYGFAPGRGHAARELGELGGVVRLALYELPVPVADIAPASLKKYATGVGNAKKEAVLAAAIRRLNYPGHDHNEADALWLLRMALDHYSPFEPGVMMPQAHREALKKVAWPELASSGALGA